LALLEFGGGADLNRVLLLDEKSVPRFAEGETGICPLIESIVHLLLTESIRCIIGWLQVMIALQSGATDHMRYLLLSRLLLFQHVLVQYALQVKYDGVLHMHILRDVLLHGFQSLADLHETRLSMLVLRILLLVTIRDER
jgi:hypothetical protein